MLGVQRDERPQRRKLCSKPSRRNRRSSLEIKPSLDRLAFAVHADGGKPSPKLHRGEALRIPQPPQEGTSRALLISADGGFDLRNG